MTRKPTTPRTKPFLSRKAKQAYEQAIADADERIARLQGDPNAFSREARRRIKANIDEIARTMPTPKLQKTAGYAKKGVHNP
jgi:hypothetical protein